MLTKLKSEESEENSGNEDTKYEEGSAKDQNKPVSVFC